MADEKVQLKEVYPVPEKIKKMAYISGREAYDKLWKRSIDDPDGFWSEVAKEYVEWFKPFDKVMDYNFDIKKGDIYVKFFEGGKLNVSYNCLDKQLKTRANKVAIQFEGNEPGDDKAITYKQLHEEVCKFANVLKSLGVKKGDRVCLYLPMIPELAISLLACTRIGAIHSVVFGGFSSDSLRDRLQDSTTKILVTCDGTFRGAKAVPQKDSADAAVADCPSVEKIVVVKRVGDKIKCNMNPAKDIWWDDAMAKASAVCEPEWMDAEDPLFILYTSGSTGKPKGVMHTTGGYLVFVAYTHKMIFDYKEEDIYWCTADIGWVTGHSYIVYGPLCNGATSVMFEGVPNYPDISRFWKIVEKYKVNIFYTAPTAIRAIAKEGNEWVKKASTPKPGTGTTTSSAAASAPSWTPGGRPRRAASSSPRSPAPLTSSPAWPPCPSRASGPSSSTTKARRSTPSRPPAPSASSAPGPASCAASTATPSASPRPTSSSSPATT